MARVKLLVPVLFLSVMILAPISTSAQTAPSDEDGAEQATTVPLNIEPADVAIQDWQIGAEAIRSVPSPIGSALPGYVYVEVGSRGAAATLFLDTKFQRYSYDCAAGRCTGFAPDLWRALARDDQRAYVDSVLNAFMQAYPDLGIYRLTLDGIGSASWDQQHGRTYRFNPPL